MGELLNDFTKYLCEVLAMNVEPEPWEGEAVLPLYLREQYQFHQLPYRKFLNKFAKTWMCFYPLWKLKRLT